MKRIETDWNGLKRIETYSNRLKQLVMVSILMVRVRGATGANRADASGRLRADRPGARTAAVADGPGACADQ